ncbi:MAG: carboxylating nicotinate-nucleotide diphosphorylase [Opitutales bacterium]
MPDPAELAALRERLSQRLPWEALDSVYLRQLIGLARAEDLEGAGLKEAPAYSGDLTTGVTAEELHPTKAGAAPPWSTAKLVAREPLVVAGLPLVPLIMETYAGPSSADAFSVSAMVADSSEAGPQTVLAELAGPAALLLQAERVLLNFLQRLSGVASTTAALVDALGETSTRLLDTRKTTPGQRMLEKYAVGCGGGWNHRLGLFDRILLKDNHLALLGGGAPTDLTEAVAQARKRFPGVPVQIEVDRPAQIEAALATGCEVILLDNFDDAQLAAAVARIDGRALTEASGGIDLERLRGLGGLGLDFVSTGALVHRSRWRDIGLDWA